MCNKFCKVNSASYLASHCNELYQPSNSYGEIEEVVWLIYTFVTLKKVMCVEMHLGLRTQSSRMGMTQTSWIRCGWTSSLINPFSLDESENSLKAAHFHVPPFCLVIFVNTELLILQSYQCVMLET
jgi:hypothetical protein